MPVSNGFTVGRDVYIDITTATGPLRLPITTTGFDAKQSTKKIESHGLDGVNRFAELPAGWSGTIDMDRSDSSLDDYFAQAEADYYAGKIVPPATITETITEANGTVSQYRYIGVVFAFSDAGKKKGDDKVSQSISWSASKRLKVL
ncbi:MAG: hypothetical protein KGL35_08370 [Bradyrhizobium sp.]|nr:hypothetical protein [Bradyrhizobium sp.]